MIKPGTLCMIRGVPKGTKGYDCNGKIVTAVEKIYEDIWSIEPHLYSKIKNKSGTITGSRQEFLHPLQDFDPEELTLQELEIA